MNHDSNPLRLHHELDKLETMQPPRLAHLFRWDREQEKVTLLPPRVSYLLAYSLGIISIMLALGLPILILILDLKNDDYTFLIFILVLVSIFLFCLGIYSFAIARNLGFTILDLKNKTIHLEKIGVFSQYDIKGITICASPYNQSFKSHFESIIRQNRNSLEDKNLVKDVTIGVQFNRKFFLKFRIMALMNYRIYRDAKSFQDALAEFFDCPCIDLNNRS